jgi:chromosome segregation ATPase
LTQTPNTPGEPGQTPPQQGDQTGQTPPPQSQTQSGQPPTTQQQQQRTPLDALPPDVQEYIRLLRDEAKTNREKLEAETRAKQQAEEERLKKQGEYQKLAEKHEQRVKELEPIAQEYNDLAEQMKVFIDTQTKDWPDLIKDYDPGPDAPVKARMAWMNKSRQHAETLAAQTRGKAPGNSPNPAPANSGGTSEQDVNELRRRIRESGKINF